VTGESKFHLVYFKFKTDCVNIMKKSAFKNNVYFRLINPVAPIRMIYLDNHATTVCDPLVLEAMIPYFTQNYGNAASNNFFGEVSANAVEQAKRQVGDLLSCPPEELTFTSGATESINIVLLGLCNFAHTNGLHRRKILTIEIEHKAVLTPLNELKKSGWEVSFLPVDSKGMVIISEAKKLIDEDIFLISVQLANSEIGTIQPIAELAEMTRENGVFFHCDASQGIGKVHASVDDLGIDFLSMSAHKIYGPKGVGALWMRAGLKKILQPIMFGGNAINNVRPGTQPVPLIVGFGKACAILQENLDQENDRIQGLRDFFEQSISEQIPEIVINGAQTKRLVNNSSITFPDIDAEMLLLNLQGIVASTGSACESGSIEPSRVLLAIGISPDAAYQTIRFGFGRFNTLKEVESAAEQIVGEYRKLAFE